MAGFIYDFGILFLIVVVISFIVKLLKQPIIIGYVLAGMLFSYFISKGSASGDLVTAISEIGITFLLFLMGLEFDFKSLKFIGKDIFILTTIQSIIFFMAAFGLALGFNFNYMDSAYIGILFMFSSTLLVAKWIDDKKDSGTLYGKIVMGILIIQDVFAIIAISILGVIQEKSMLKILLAPLTGIALIFIAFIFMRYILNYLLKIAVRYPELFFIFSLGVCFLFVEIASLIGYSTTIGAFIGGVALANTLYKNDVHSRLKPLIVFFNMLFFVGLGFQINHGLDLRVIFFIALLCVLSLILKPIIAYITMKMRGYDDKTALLTGLSLAQESEFGMIIVAGGVSSGIIGGGIGTIAVLSVILTMIASSYLIKYNKKIYSVMEKHLKKIGRLQITKEMQQEPVDLKDYHILFFGYYDLGKDLFSKLSGMGKKILVIENDPENIEILEIEGAPYVYNSVNNPYFFERLNLSKVELIISSLVDIDDNKMIINESKKRNPQSAVIVTAKNLKDALELYNNNADYVICPSYLNEQRVSVLLEDYTTDVNKVITKKVNEITMIKEMEKKRTETAEKSMFFNVERFFKIAQKGDKLKGKKKEDDHGKIPEKAAHETKPQTSADILK